MASQEPIDHGPFANTRSKKLDAKYLTSDEKEVPKRSKRASPVGLSRGSVQPVFNVAEANRVADVLSGMGVDVADVSSKLLVTILNDVADRGNSYILDENS